MNFFVTLKNSKKRTGFTLVELLVVVSIVGVLGSIVTTSVRGRVNKAKGANSVQALYATDKAFVLKALDDNIVEWWAETGVNGIICVA